MDSTEGAQSAHSLEGTSAIMVELKVGFKAIDARFDALTMQVDRMHKHLDDHSSRLGDATQQILEIKDGATALAKRVERDC
ncbi:hypothetical protein NDU88_010849 [Pleurodeles waltl]|uniref:Uncharacterized protein n=1 Tax=Pleurodeles waltl TaxID=8319 RepID=A0AAV7QZE7_PLEWA|nr:hypothetical protein NDU88_010849 [Pleurodeles waltl]